MISDPGSIIVAAIAAFASIFSVIALFYKSRGENKNAETNSKNALDARIDARLDAQLKDAWVRIDNLEKNQKEQNEKETRRTLAVTRILRAIAKQWTGSEGPDLDPADIAEIEETIPVGWIRTNKKTT